MEEDDCEGIVNMLTQVSCKSVVSCSKKSKKPVNFILDFPSNRG